MLGISKKFHLWTSRAGYTIVELLVVVAILAVLMGIGMGSYGNAQKASRDARRRADLKQMQTAMEQYFSTNAASYSNGCTNMAANFSGGIPTDPLSNAPIGCTVTGGGLGYCLFTDLEKDEGNCTYSGGTCSFVSTETGTHFCLTNVQ